MPESTPPRPIYVVCVCTHNRTRSVMAGALLKRHLTRLRVPAVIDTAGLMSDGMPPTDRAVRLLADRGIDVSSHASKRIDESTVADADLIVTAEHQHVVSIAGRFPQAFRFTFTLPEVVARAEAVPARGDAPFAEWLQRIAVGRPAPFDYLDATDIAEIADPTGQSPSVWDTAYAQIDALTRRLAERLA